MVHHSLAIEKPLIHHFLAIEKPLVRPSSGHWPVTATSGTNDQVLPGSSPSPQSAALQVVKSQPEVRLRGA